jgi:hypothetical protein
VRTRHVRTIGWWPALRQLVVSYDAGAAFAYSNGGEMVTPSEFISGTPVDSCAPGGTAAMTTPERTKDDRHRQHGTTDQPERSHERSPDDPGRGQGDILDDQIPQSPGDTRTPKPGKSR